MEVRRSTNDRRVDRTSNEMPTNNNHAVSQQQYKDRAQDAPEIMVRFHFVRHEIQQKYAIIAENKVIFEQLVFRRHDNTDGVASQQPTMRGFPRRRRDGIAEFIAEQFRLIA